MWHSVIRDLPYDYELSQNIYDNFNSLFLIFKESGIKISNDTIEETFNKLGYNKDSCTIVPLYNIVKGIDIKESLNIVDDHMRSTVKNYTLNSNSEHTSLYEIVDQLEDILGPHIDMFKDTNYHYIKSNLIETPIEIRAGFELQIEGQYVELRIDINDHIYIMRYDDDFGFFVPGFGFAYNTKLLDLYMGKILTQLG